MARLRNITMRDDGDGVESATFSFSLLELIYLCKLLGKQSGNDANAVMPGGDRASSAVFAVLRRPLLAFYEEAEDDRAAIEQAWSAIGKAN